MEIKNFVSIEEGILKLVREASGTESDNKKWVILGEQEYCYVECTRTGRKRLAMKTFYKTRTAPESAVP